MSGSPRQDNMAFVIHSLKMGGSEKFLIRLLNGLSNSISPPLLILLEDHNPLLQEVDAVDARQSTPEPPPDSRPAAAASAVGAGQPQGKLSHEVHQAPQRQKLGIGNQGEVVAKPTKGGRVGW